MKLRIFMLLAISLSFTALSFAHQTLAQTEDGKKVILDSNGIWKYLPEKELLKSNTATKEFKSEVIPFGISYDPQIWKMKKSTNEDAEVGFDMINGNAYAFMINEDVGLSAEFMKELILENFENTTDEFEVIKAENRVVNGLSVLYFQINATIKKLKFSYMIYAYVGEEETVQFFTLSYAKHFEKNKSKMEELLNGFFKVKSGLVG